MAVAAQEISLTAHARPEAARLTLIDALRGAALFGVLIVNMLWFAGEGHAVTSAQFAALPSAGIDAVADNLIDLLVAAKAIGIFSFLFGVGFAMQIPKLGSRYVRRLGALLAVGLVHWLAVWSGEILHVYAIAGFILLCVYRLRAAVLVPLGLVLAIFARPLVGRLYLLSDSGATAAAHPDSWSMAERFAVMSHGHFTDIVALQLQQDCRWQVLSGATLAAVVHALGRFMVGVAVARGGYLREPERYKRAFGVLAMCLLPVGFVLEHDWLFTGWLTHSGLVSQPTSVQIIGHAVNSAGIVCMTAGYIALFALLWQWSPLQRLLAWLVPAGRMALTNYLSQTLICYLLFAGFGLALIGKVGVAGCLAISTAVFIAQALVSRWWLASFNFGPFEWLWRWWTYGERPALRRAVAA